MGLNRYERKLLRKPPDTIVREGIYKFQNNARGELYLPRPTASGVKKVGIGQQFQGDSYYLNMVKTGELKLLEVIQLPSQQKQVLTENTMTNDKLILEQPPTVTEGGKVEYVIPKKTQKKLNENQPTEQPTSEILLNEDPLDGIELM